MVKIYWRNVELSGYQVKESKSHMAVKNSVKKKQNKPLKEAKSK